jgi:hypothetical protein
MSLQTVLSNIESHDFAARLGVANNMGMFIALAEREEAVKELVQLLQDRDNASKLLDHVAAQLKEQEDVRYRNSRDAAVAVCIWALKQSQPTLAGLLASHVLGAPRFWWARRVATDFSGGLQAPSTAGPASFTLVKKKGWTSGGSEGKEVLVIPEMTLISNRQIAGPGTVTATSNTVMTSTALPGEMTTSSSLTQTQLTVVEIP